MAELLWTVIPLWVGRASLTVTILVVAAGLVTARWRRDPADVELELLVAEQERRDAICRAAEAARHDRTGDAA